MLCAVVQPQSLYRSGLPHRLWAHPSTLCGTKNGKWRAQFVAAWHLNTRPSGDSAQVSPLLNLPSLATSLVLKMWAIELKTPVQDTRAHSNLPRHMAQIGPLNLSYLTSLNSKYFTRLVLTMKSYNNGRRLLLSFAVYTPLTSQTRIKKDTVTVENAVSYSYKVEFANKTSSKSHLASKY